jgi:hypothetical protein
MRARRGPRAFSTKATGAKKKNRRGFPGTQKKNRAFRTQSLPGADGAEEAEVI